MEKNRRGFLQILAYPSELGHFTSFLQVSGHDGKTEKNGLGSDFEIFWVPEVRNN